MHMNRASDFPFVLRIKLSLSSSLTPTQTLNSGNKTKKRKRKNTRTSNRDASQTQKNQRKKNPHPSPKPKHRPRKPTPPIRKTLQASHRLPQLPHHPIPLFPECSKCRSSSIPFPHTNSTVFFPLPVRHTCSYSSMPLLQDSFLYCFM